MIIIEHMSSLKLPNNIGEFELRKSRKFGKSSLSYFSPKELTKMRKNFPYIPFFIFVIYNSFYIFGSH